MGDKQNTEEYNCEYAQNNICGCDADDVDDEDGCLNTCYANNGLSYCIEDEDECDQFDAMDYAVCAQYEYEADDDAYRRRLDEADEDANQDDAYEAEDQVKEMCEEIYMVAGKCESDMGIQYPSEDGCSYIEGIKITRDDGIIRTSSTRASKGAAVAVGLFATSAIFLGAYVYYLRTKLGHAKI